MTIRDYFNDTIFSPWKSSFVFFVLCILMFFLSNDFLDLEFKNLILSSLVWANISFHVTSYFYEKGGDVKKTDVLSKFSSTKYQISCRKYAVEILGSISIISFLIAFLALVLGFSNLDQMIYFISPIVFLTLVVLLINSYSVYKKLSEHPILLSVFFVFSAFFVNNLSNYIAWGISVDLSDAYLASSSLTKDFVFGFDWKIKVYSTFFFIFLLFYFMPFFFLFMYAFNKNSKIQLFLPCVIILFFSSYLLMMKSIGDVLNWSRFEMKKQFIQEFHKKPSFYNLECLENYDYVRFYSNDGTGAIFSVFLNEEHYFVKCD